MARAAKKAAPTKSLEKRPWEAADELRGNQEPSENQRHEALGLSVAEAAFYDAIVQNDAAVLQMRDDTLYKMAAGLLNSIRESATLDWNLKHSVRAAMRAKVRRLLAKYDYPPDLEEKATELVLEQAELYASAEGGYAA